MYSLITYVINLERDTEKFDWCKSQFAKLDIEFTRINAVDMYELGENPSALVTPGVMACWLSHKKALMDFLDTPHDYALIMEDDFHVKNFSKVKRLLRNSWLNDWDVIQVGFLSPGYQNQIRVSLSNIEQTLIKSLAATFKFFRAPESLTNRLRIKAALQSPKGWVPASFEPGTHCYLISRKAAKLVITLNEPQFLSADDFYTALAKMRSLKFLRPYRSLAAQFKFPKFPGPRFTQQ
jgi:GR25 family glycosyltransferase involved in LPS biosynthesis